MDKKDRILLQTAIYLIITVPTIAVMLFSSLLFSPWDMNYTWVYGIKVVSEGKCILAYFVWFVCSVFNGACAVWALFFNRYFFALSLALTAVCILNFLYIPEYRVLSEVFFK